MLTRKRVGGALALLAISGIYFLYHTPITAQHTLFIQLPFDVPALTDMQKTLTPVINQVIEKELEGFDLDRDVPLFFFKKRQAITICYVNDMREDGQDFLFKSLDSLHTDKDLKNITVTQELDFFGEPKPDRMALVDLVAHINDAQQGLSDLNVTAKKAVHSINDEYQKLHSVQLYDKEKSDKYPFTPHLTVGHLRANYIKHVVQDETRANAIIERLKQQIMHIISTALSNLSLKDRTISFSTVSIYDLSKRAYVKERDLKE